MSEHISAIKDPDELVSVRKRMSQVVRRTSDGRFMLTRAENWVAIPQEGASHLTESARQRLFVSFRDQGLEFVYAVAIENLSQIVPAYRVTLSLDGLSLFNSECAHFNYVLCPPDVSCLVICTTDDYTVYAGRRDFVNKALGETEHAAMTAFEEYARDSGWSSATQEFFGRILVALRDEYPRSRVGTAVYFPGQ